MSEKHYIYPKARKYAMHNYKTIFLFPNGIRETLGISQAAMNSNDNSIPKAYINYLFFDKHRQFVRGGFDKVSEDSRGAFEKLSVELIPDEEGYVFIYTANQTDEDLDVYFDDMTVEHIEGPIIQ